MFQILKTHKHILKAIFQIKVG